MVSTISPFSIPNFILTPKNLKHHPLIPIRSCSSGVRTFNFCLFELFWPILICAIHLYLFAPTTFASFSSHYWVHILPRIGYYLHQNRINYYIHLRLVCGKSFIYHYPIYARHSFLCLLLPLERSKLALCLNFDYFVWI